MDFCNMVLANRYSQIDHFARKLALSAIFALTLTLWIFRNSVRTLSAATLLCFTVTFVVFILVLNEILHRKWFQPRISPENKAVLITGCDRGFGYGFARTLAEAGFQVFAGCLYPFQGEAAKLNCHPRIHCLQMDVTKPEEIQLALDYIVRHLHKNELWAVVNNAGVSKGSDIEATSMQKIEEVLDVNLMGTIRVTKMFLPLLRKSKGRIINVASAAGRLLLPGFLPYSVSKSAVIAFSDGLRLEMRKYDVHVISVEPWIYKTKLSDPSEISREIEREWHRTEETGGDTATRNNRVAELQRAAMDLFQWGVSSNLEEVFEVIHEAVTMECPPYRYSPGRWYLNTALWCMHFVPKPVLDFVFCKLIFKR